MQNIPKADLNEFLSGNSNKKTAFVKKIGTAFQEIGFLALKGHFLEDKLQDALYKQIHSFFKLSNKVKSSYEIKGGGGQRGYTGFGKEHAAGRSVGDLKEFWHFGQDVQSKPFLKNIYPENIIVKELENFNKIGNLVFLKLEKTAKIILQALAIYLKLDQQYFDEFVDGGNSILRAIHYPPIKEPPKEAERAAAHGDINLITLLIGAQGSGLQVLNRQNQWIDAIAKPDELMINIGDMLSRLTNNLLPSTIHRVVNPPKKTWGNSRYSLPFFMHPIPQMPLNCLPQTVDKNNLKKYEDILAGEFLFQRLVALGLIKK
tara:strand:- start:1202 stop:2152 length:951 start_codon:yes stop_codon:yes gene_type:complete